MSRAINLNVKHLQYFWAVAKFGGVARASERMHVTPQSISGQIGLLEDAVGEPLMHRVGRSLELTDTGRLVFDHADRMFSAADELKLALRDRPSGRQVPFRVGVADVVVKSLAYRMLRPSLDIEPAPRLFCREGRLSDLLGELAIQRLDLVLSDRPMPANLNVVGFNHLLGECGISFLATEELARRVAPRFPHSLDQAPMLLSGEESAMRARLQRWFADQGVAPRVVGEFEDSGLLKAFGETGTGVFVMPSVVAGRVCRQFRVVEVGRTADVTEQVYAISAERRLSHPAVVAIGRSAPAAFVDEHEADSPATSPAGRLLPMKDG
jgi:LysR family transcriptional regulator, transcriptional activator of nhaA